MSLKDYIDVIAPTPDWLAGIHAASKRRGTDKLSMRQIVNMIVKARRQNQTKSI